MTIQDLKSQKLILFEVISGSKSFGLDTPSSDTDIKGVYYLPKEQFFGLDYIPQISNKTNDAVYYEPFTYLDGIMEKYVPGDYEFDVPQKLIDLYTTKDYGKYSVNGKIPVCFIATNHTTGGNSGSPALDAKGNLVGLNFDRVWEGTMSDIYYSPDICRNIMVDVRYVLFIIDKFAGAQNIIKELKIIDSTNKK